jgi:hypothetical protein
MAAGFPKGHKVFVVIHGIGEQNPFETLDSFTRGLVRYLKSKVQFKLEHRIAERKGADGSDWVESFVRLSPPQGDDWIDIHEYYWAYLTEEKISPSEVLEWVVQTLEGTIRFYDENQDLRQRYETRPGRPRFRLRKVVRVLRWIYPLIRVARFLVPHWIRLRAVREWVERRATWILVGYIGDIAIYTTMDQKSRHYEIRQRILKESQALLEAILAEAPEDAQVIVAGHSLGSVIAYDTLNRLNIKANLPAGEDLPLKKLAGLITFGSPLDKVAFFFREHAGKDQYVRRQIMEHLHSFKAKPLSSQEDQKEPYVLANPVAPKLDHLPWVNYWSKNDPISGHLDFYQIPDQDNVCLDLPEKWGVAHVRYWCHMPFYEDIARRFLWASLPATDSAKACE